MKLLTTLGFKKPGVNKYKELNQKIKNISNSENKIEIFNKLVHSINSYDLNGVKLKEFSNQTTELDFESNIGDINGKIGFIVSRINEENAKQEKLIGIDQSFLSYQDNVLKEVSLETEVYRLQQLLLDFNQLEDKQKETLDVNNQILRLTKELHEIKNINSLKRSYSLIVQNLSSLTKEKSTLIEQNLEKTKKRNEVDLEKVKLEKRRSLILQNERDLDENLEILASVFLLIQNNKSWESNAEKRLQLCRKIKGKRDSSTIALRTEIAILQSIYQSSLQSFASESYIYKDFKDAAKKIASSYHSLQSMKEKLELLENTYSKTGSLEENLQKIIEIGRSFIEETQSDTCPLCNIKQNSFERLLALVSIQKNDVLGLHSLRNQIQNLNEKIQIQELEVTTLFSTLVKSLKTREDELNIKLQVINKKVFGTETLISHYNTKDALIDDENKRLLAQYEEIESKNDLIKLILEDSNETKISLTQRIGLLKEEISNLNIETQQIERRLQEIDASVRIEISNQDYLKVNQYLLENSFDPIEFITSGLDEKINQKNASIRILENQSKEISNQIAALSIKIHNLDKSDINRKMQDESYSLKLLKDQIFNYKNLYQILIKKEEIFIDSIKTEIKNQKKQLDKLIFIERCLRELQENIEFMRQNLDVIILRNKLSEVKIELNALQKTNGKLAELKNEVSEFIKKKIDMVFDQRIINDIYKKIDPHPEFKHIKLEPVFDGVKPRLNIKAVNSTSTNEIDPILYLSSAQVNILSLSIFLAKALQNKDVLINTIFMDDPIQYLDSINVLSFIDLLRAITTDKSIDRQLVISTHDENFFNMLKKKLVYPNHNSKFIEFETYGRLKT